MEIASVLIYLHIGLLVRHCYTLSILMQRDIKSIYGFRLSFDKREKTPGVKSQGSKGDNFREENIS